MDPPPLSGWGVQRLPWCQGGARRRGGRGIPQLAPPPRVVRENRRAPPGARRRRHPPTRNEGSASGTGRETRSPPLTTKEGKALSCHIEGHMIIVRAEEKTEKRKGMDSSTDQKNRHEEPIRAENYAC